MYCVRNATHTCSLTFFSFAEMIRKAIALAGYDSALNETYLMPLYWHRSNPPVNVLSTLVKVRSGVASCFALFHWSFISHYVDHT